MTNNVTIEVKSMKLATYIGLCFVAWIIGYVVLVNFTYLLGNTYAETTGIVIIGFWAGKAVLKNKRRDWVSIVAFPVINFITAIFAAGLTGVTQSYETISIVCLVIAFILSCGLFALLKTKP